jgi:hypothetical protein
LGWVSGNPIAATLGAIKFLGDEAVVHHISFWIMLVASSKEKQEAGQTLKSF